MPGERLLRILGHLSAADHPGGDAERVCRVGVDVVGVSGAGIMLMSDAMPRGSVCTTDAVSSLLEELQYTLGEGPCVDAFGHDRPVLEPDLANPEMPRWPAFSPSALQSGASAVFGFPLSVGSARLGALNFYRDGSGALSDEQYADAVVIAGVAAEAVLAMQAAAPAGDLGVAFGAGANLHLVVHQASGMVAAQLGVSVTEALMRLRAHAFANEHTLTEVAEAVVGRRLRFT